MDIYVIAGQSNASGQGTNNQSYSHATLHAWNFANDYTIKDLVDPVDDRTGQVDTVSDDGPGGSIGSVWPLLATHILAGANVEVMFVPCSLSSTSITQWLPGVDHQDRSTLYGSMVYRALQAAADSGGTLKGVLWWQGESDGVAGMSQATYNGHLDTIANAIAGDLLIPLMPCQLQNNAGISAGDEAKINDAIAEAWADNPNVAEGPSFTDIASDDSFHIKIDVKLQTVADRWWTAIENVFYSDEVADMATYFPPKKNTAFIIYVALESVATAGAFQANPTLASGDFKVSIDGGTLTNLGTLPTVIPTGGKMVKISLAQAEMNGDNITVVCSDASGGEWKDLVLNFQTTANQIDDLATPTNITAGTITTATNVTNVNGLAAGVITAVSISADAITAAKVAADVTTEIQSGLATQASVNTIDDFLDTEIAAIIAAIGALNNLSAADINTQLLDVMVTDTFAEPSAVPAATASLKDKIGWLAALARNKLTQTSTTTTLRNDADSASIATSTTADDGTTFSRTEWS